MNDDKIEQILARGVSEVLPTKDGLADLMKKRRIRLYNGIDPTSTRLHLGHTIALRKLQEFADLGHEAILVIGTGTVIAGDPSLRDKVRPKITAAEIKNNIKTWKKQAGKVLNFSKVKVKYNGDWLLKLGLREINEIASNISAIKLFQREMFQRRIKNGDTVWMNETIYPLLQGYDSVALDVDLEIGGTDQVFNMLIGRELQQKIHQKEKFVMTLNMILGTDGKTMSKTSGNCIWLDDSADQMFGKIMSIPDDLVPSYFETLTRVPKKETESLAPFEAKKKLAQEITALYHGPKAAQVAAEEFSRIFQKKELPSEMPEFLLQGEEMNILDLLVKIKIASSRSEARRLILQGGVKINGRVENDWQKKVKLVKDDVIQAGKRKFVKIL